MTVSDHLHPVLRVARPTDDLAALLPFYCAGLGFQILSEFKGHNGFDGLILGQPHAPYHLEFTQEHGHRAGGAPSPEHLLVLYLPDQAYEQARQRMQRAGFEPVKAHNPYWDAHGVTYADPDGYRVVLYNRAWPK